MQRTDRTELCLNISAVERETGLSKDTLRVWERRYGFPEPLREAHGERVYPVSQVEKLQVIKRLMERGHRPGKIIGLNAADLEALSTRPHRDAPLRQDLEIYLRLLRTHQLHELRRHLTQALGKQGLQGFVMNTIAPLNVAIGNAWMRGELAVFEEHLYTEHIQGVLRSAVSAILPQARSPRVLLTSFPAEPHYLGLLMVEAVLAVEGATCIPLGTETPLADISRAALAHDAHVVALSFSAAFNPKHAATGLAELRAMLPASIAIWAGGAAVAQLRKSIDGVEVIPGLDSVIDKVKAWRTLHASD